MNALLQQLRTLPDARKARGKRHLYFSVVTIAIAAILAGSKSYAAIAEWAERLSQNQLKRLRSWYDHKRKRLVPPSEATIRRVLQSSDVEQVEQCLGQWVYEVTNEKNIAVDGKVLKGAKQEDGYQLRLLSAFLHQQGGTIAQVEVGEKTNEIPMLKELLQNIDIEGGVVTADALHTQVKSAKYIVEEKKADYVFIVKGNQKTLLEDIAVIPQDDFPPSAHHCR